MKRPKAKKGREQAVRAPKRRVAPRGRATPAAPQPPAAEQEQQITLLVGGDWFRQAQVTVPQPKQAISFRVDPDVLEFFKDQGPRYQTRMNAVLRAYMTAHGEEGES